MSFVPPDGHFELMRYRVRDHLQTNVMPPVYCNPTVRREREGAPKGMVGMVDGLGGGEGFRGSSACNP